MFSFFRGGGGEAKDAEEVSPHVLQVQGTICCRSCGCEQPFTQHECMECRNDPWAEPGAGWGGAPPVLPTAPPDEPGPFGGGGGGGGGHHVDAGAEAALVDMGIDREWARLALSRCGNDVEQATDFCFSNDMGTLVAASNSSSASPSSSSSSSSSSSAWSPSASRSPASRSPGSPSRGRGHEESSYEALADKHAECAVCFDPLCAHPAAVFRDAAGRRTCHHFFHASCAQEWARQCSDPWSGSRASSSSSGGAVRGACPLCNAPFRSVTPVPDIDADPDAWFDACDMDGDGSLNTREVFEILKAQFPIDYEKLEGDLPRLWSRWDPSMDGQIQRHEFLDPNDGLLAFVRRRFLRQERAGRGAATQAAPDIRASKEAWFAYVDEDRSGELSIEEVTRGLIKSFHLSADLAQLHEMKDLVANVWCIFDHDGSGEVDREEFLRPNDGMADSIIASFQHHK